MAYRALHPSCKVPALADGDDVLTESGAIVNDLLRRFGQQAGLELPVDPVRPGRDEEWSSLALMELDAASLYLIRRHVDLSAVYGVAPVAVEGARQYAQRAIAALTQRLGADDHAMGASISGADILVTTSLEALRTRGLVLPAAVDDHRMRVTARLTCARHRQATRQRSPPDDPSRRTTADRQQADARLGRGEPREGQLTESRGCRPAHDRDGGR